MGASPQLDAADGSKFNVLAPTVSTLDGGALPGGVSSADTQMTELVETSVATGGNAQRVGLRGWFQSLLSTLTDGSQVVAPSGAGDAASALTPNRAIVASAGTAVTVHAGSLPCKWITVQAFKGNADDVAVGGSGVVAAVGSQTGIILTPGSAVTIPVSDANLVFVDAIADGDGVSWLVGA